jgi:hypothetical protein
MTRSSVEIFQFTAKVKYHTIAVEQQIVIAVDIKPEHIM